MSPNDLWKAATSMLAASNNCGLNELRSCMPELVAHDVGALAGKDRAFPRPNHGRTSDPRGHKTR